MLAAPWPAPPATLGLSPDEVHVWRVTLDLPPAALAALAQTLSSDEQVRAARFRFARDRARAIAARGQLRAVLGRYLHRAPRRLRFATGPHGKPHLAVPTGRAALRFNLAHAEDLGLVAVAWRREVGVDVERERGDRVDLDVARRMFVPEDADALEVLPPGARQRAFFALWTLREAYAKGTGLGLSDAAAEAPPASWTVRQLPIDAGFAAAVAVEGRGVRVRCWDAPPAAALGERLAS
jgi:4'-phosphopantetheinyl transferase